ncbi:hypothetical protein BT96DRAFT_979748 [Gymnopus androsaceus JB14]|uniref:Uncharacterized protein n=1 Tax=Gymnopus androsaceus JB14 TaxID=1447944 RepID=A0A6A4H0G4_9AGAR|nr:hypothetical protein BT96DRAFT_979748 [Gymnopus androsaceus JB14]
MNGIYTAIILAVIYSSTISKESRSSRNLLLGLTLVMYMLSVTHLAGTWVTLRSAFVLAGTPLQTFVILNSPPLWERVIGAAMPCIGIIIADCVIIWRAWVVWGKRFKVVVLPGLLSLTSTAFAILTITAQADISNTTYQGNVYVQAAITFFSLSLATTVICSGLIIYRILSMRSDSGSYNRVVEAITESVILYSITVIIYVPVTAVESRPNRSSVSFNSAYIQSVMFPMSGIGPTLLILRSILGLTRAQDTWSPTSPDNSLIFAGISSVSRGDAETFNSGHLTAPGVVSDSSLSPESKDLLAQK